MKLLRFLTVPLFIASFLTGFWLGSAPVEAAGACYCEASTVIDAKPEDVDTAIFSDRTKFDAQCLASVPKEDCVARSKAVDTKFTKCLYQETVEACNTLKTGFDSALQLNLKNVLLARNGTLQPPAAGTSETDNTSNQGLLGRILPDCVFDSSVQGECKDVSVFIKLAIDLANVLLSVVGGLALLAFLYGGFVLILSQGNAEQIDKGKSAMVAALIGLAVVFGAYLLVNILSDALNVGNDFRLS